MGFQFIVPRSAFRVSVVEAVEALVEGDELSVRVVESAALDSVLDGVESLEGRGQFVVARAAALARFESAGGGAARARERGQGVCALPLLQVDLDLRDAVARLLDLRVTFGQLRRVDDGRPGGPDR